LGLGWIGSDQTSAVQCSAVSTIVRCLMPQAEILGTWLRYLAYLSKPQIHQMHQVEVVDGGSLLPTTQNGHRPRRASIIVQSCVMLCMHAVFNLLYCTRLDVVRARRLRTGKVISKMIYYISYGGMVEQWSSVKRTRTPVGQHCHNSVPADQSRAQVLAHSTWPAGNYPT
jgi:hypothetical protein